MGKLINFKKMREEVQELEKYLDSRGIDPRERIILLQEIIPEYKDRLDVDWFNYMEKENKGGE